jgi:hypothetical protein
MLAAWMVLLRIHGIVEMGEHVAKWVLNWSLKLLQVICCHQTFMLVLAIGISVRMLNSRGRKEVSRYS